MIEGAIASLDSVLRTFSTLATLSTDDRAVVGGWRTANRLIERGRDIRDAEGCRILISGVVARYHDKPDGLRRILAFNVPGDILDPPRALGSELDSNIMAVSSVVLAVVSQQDVDEAVRKSSAIRLAFVNAMLLELSIARRWLATVGHLEAQAKMAHLLCEFAWRLNARSGGELYSFTLPVTQNQLGEALGLTSVHVNRTLRVMQDAGLIAYGAGHVNVLDPEKLCSIGQFDPAYLSIRVHEARG